MKRTIRLLSLGLVLMVTASVAGCSSQSKANDAANTAAGSGAAKESQAGGGQEAKASPDEKQVKIKFSLSQAAAEPAVLAAQSFKEEVEEKSGGSITVEVYPDNQLGSERDVIEGLQIHTVEMVDPANAVLTNFIDELSIFELPMLFESKEHVYAALDDIGMSYAGKCEEQGFKLLGWFDMGSRNIMTVSKPIESMEDLSGLKIRTQESTANMAGFTAFGASPTPMAYNELYTALESGVLDGAEAANTNYYLKAFYEVAPNWAIVGWLECVNPVLMDLQFWNNMSDNQRAIVEAAAANMVTLERELYAKSEDDYLAELEKLGVNITYPDRAPFKEASKEAYEKFAEQVGGMDKIEAVINYKH